MTTRGAGGLPKQQFFLSGLNASTEYNVYLTLPLNTSTQAGTVFTPGMSIKTKASNNCQLVFNLPFCTETAYAAPANPNILNSSALNSFYDTLASNLFANFSTTLQLQACNTTQSAQYSLFPNCTTCQQAYKNWLCAVTIPRCADVTDPAPYLFERPVNTSRQPLIDQVVQPGAYKEFMPCSDLCWGIEQNCPSTLQFQCPIPGSLAMQQSYVEDKTGKTCNAPQLQYLASSARKLGVAELWVLVGVFVHLAFWIAWDWLFVLFGMGIDSYHWADVKEITCHPLPWIGSPLFERRIDLRHTLIPVCNFSDHHQLFIIHSAATMSTPSVKFNPALSVQRQGFILESLRQVKPKSVLDIGCGEGQLLECLVRCDDFLPIEVLAGIDVSLTQLESAASIIIQSANFQQEEGRWHSLDIVLLQGIISRKAALMQRIFYEAHLWLKHLRSCHLIWSNWTSWSRRAWTLLGHPSWFVTAKYIDRDNAKSRLQWCVRDSREDYGRLWTLV